MPTTAYAVEKRRLCSPSGLETTVSLLAAILFGIEIAIVLIEVGAIIYTGPQVLLTYLFASLVLLGGLFLAYFQWVLLRCIAEGLRLLKKIAGANYQGQITGPRMETVLSCSNCGQMLHSESCCDACGATIEKKGPPSQADG